jgi:hypothetical protein
MGMCILIVVGSISVFWFGISIFNAVLVLLNSENTIFEECSGFDFFVDRWKELLDKVEGNIYGRIFYPIIIVIGYCFFLLLTFFFPIGYSISWYIDFVMKK